MPTITGVWVVPTADEDAAEPPVLRKSAAGKAYLAFDFGNFPEVAAGASIASAALADEPDGLTIGTATLAGYNGATAAPYRVAAWYEGGQAGDYTVTCTATLTDGSVLVGKGTLRVA